MHEGCVLPSSSPILSLSPRTHTLSTLSSLSLLGFLFRSKKNHTLSLPALFTSQKKPSGPEIEVHHFPFLFFFFSVGFVVFFSFTLFLFFSVTLLFSFGGCDLFLSVFFFHILFFSFFYFFLVLSFFFKTISLSLFP